MDLIERLLGIAPDGGDGSMEGLIFSVLVACLALWGLTRMSRRHGLSDRD
jgi:hypothetical protein